MCMIIIGETIFNKGKIANSFSSRLKGLMFTENIKSEEGLLLENCNSIHTFFMNFEIDVAYIDKNYIVIGKETIKPWRIGKLFIGTKHVFESSKNSMNNIKIGEKLSIIKTKGENYE